MGKKETNELRKKISDKGVTPPESLSESQLMDCLALVEAGSKQSEIDDYFKVEATQQTPTPAEKPAEEKLQAPPEQVPFSNDQLQKMIADAAATAIENYKKALAAEPTPQAPSTVVFEGRREEKPNLFDTRHAPQDDFMKDEFSVLHSNNGHMIDAFEIDGRLVAPPYSRFIMFSPYDGPETNKFGDATSHVHMCIYRTRSRKEMELFKKSKGWGTEFWTNKGTVDTDEVALQKHTFTAFQHLSGMTYDAIKAMAIDNSVESTNLDTMRTQLAILEGKRQHEVLKKAQQTVRAQREKEQLMVAK